MAAPISDDVALRLGLAARALPDTDVTRLLRVLSDAVGLPPSKGKLGKLTVKALRAAADGELNDVDIGPLKEAVAILKGEHDAGQAPLPSVQPYLDGDMPGSIRVACASNQGENLDGHFGSCRYFLVYQASAAEVRLIDVREVEDSGAEDDKNAYRAGLIADCQVLYVMSVGGPAAAKVVKAGIHPVKFPQGGHAREQVEKLIPVLAGSPPPWLSKVMGQAPEERVRFEREAAES